MVTTGKVPAPPDDLTARGRGRRFWRAVLADHVLRADELELLAESCRMLDLSDRLRVEADAGPVIVDGRVNAALVELRQVREALRKTLAALALPDDPGDVDDDPQPVTATDMRTARARKAARARWDRENA